MKTVKHILPIIFIILSGFWSHVLAKDGKEIRGVLVTVAYDTLEGFIKRYPNRKLFNSIKFRPVSSCEYKHYNPSK